MTRSDSRVLERISGHPLFMARVGVGQFQVHVRTYVRVVRKHHYSCWKGAHRYVRTYNVCCSRTPDALDRDMHAMLLPDVTGIMPPKNVFYEKHGDVDKVFALQFRLCESDLHTKMYSMPTPSLQVRLNWLLHVTQGLGYLHSRKMLHRPGGNTGWPHMYVSKAILLRTVPRSGARTYEGLWILSRGGGPAPFPQQAIQNPLHSTCSAVRTAVRTNRSWVTPALLCKSGRILCFSWYVGTSSRLTSWWTGATPSCATSG